MVSCRVTRSARRRAPKSATSLTAARSPRFVRVKAIVGRAASGRGRSVRGHDRGEGSCTAREEHLHRDLQGRSSSAASASHDASADRGGGAASRAPAGPDHVLVAAERTAVEPSVEARDVEAGLRRSAGAIRSPRASAAPSRRPTRRSGPTAAASSRLVPVGALEDPASRSSEPVRLGDVLEARREDVEDEVPAGLEELHARLAAPAASRPRPACGGASETGRSRAARARRPGTRAGRRPAGRRGRRRRAPRRGRDRREHALARGRRRSRRARAPRSAPRSARSDRELHDRPLAAPASST